MTTTITRADLNSLQGMTPKLERFFEELFISTQATTATAGQALASTRAIQDATVLTLSPNDAFDNERVLSVGDGLLLTDNGTDVGAVLALVYPITLNGGYPCTFNLEADTNLDLPSSGRVLTTDDLTFPGPFADDASAATGGVAVNGAYRKTGGTVAWRQA